MVCTERRQNGGGLACATQANPMLLQLPFSGLQLITCVTVGKFLFFYMPQFPICKIRAWICIGVTNSLISRINSRRSVVGTHKTGFEALPQ